MVFSSSIFIFAFLPLLLFLYFISKKNIKNYVLLFFSLVFYAWGGPKFLFVMLFIVAVDYILAILINTAQEKDCKKQAKLFLSLAVISNVGILGYYKYTIFFMENINAIFGTDWGMPDIVMPIGISFFTFQALSYVIDVYRKDVAAQKNFFYVLLYVSLFPQLVAGPIVRYSTVEKEITDRKVSIQDMCEGLERFIIGFAKKIILANKLGELADLVYDGEVFFTTTIWLAAFAYMLQIYFDFSAYSDMAIGLGRIFGFHFNENFNFPYISKSVTEFWRRWHISLSTWFRDYIYIPLGGNRCKKSRWLFNLFIVWFVTGMWHGASWNFIIWGLYYYCFLLIEKLFLNKYMHKIPSVIQHLYAIFIVLIGWVIFRVEDVSQIVQVLKIMFSNHITTTSLQMTEMYLCKYGIYIVLAIILSAPIYNYINRKIFNSLNKEGTRLSIALGTKYVLLLILFFVTVLFLVNSTYNPFIYFRF